MKPTQTALTYRQIDAERDLQPVVDLINARTQALLGVDQEDADAVRSFWKLPAFHLDTDALVACDENDTPVGYAEMYDPNPEHVSLHLYVAVAPAHANRGVEADLLDWCLQRAREAAGLAGADLRAAADFYLPAPDLLTAALLEARGFAHIRSSYSMTVDLNGVLRPVEWPQAVRVVSLAERPDLFPQAVRAIREAFRDHFGHVEEPFEVSLERWQHIRDDDPRFEPELFVIALEGEEIAGVCFSTSHFTEDAQSGWVNSLAVRRPWRKQGLGLALLQNAFNQFTRLGKTRGGLGVDASNLTGALRLYQKAGMRVMHEYRAFELELRSGREIVTRSLD